ncbi:MAG: serine hydrolase [Ignavibacteriae bacterium]|nr:serine hydrolase [Ignavibacteriota bacterium]
MRYTYKIFFHLIFAFFLCSDIYKAQVISNFDSTRINSLINNFRTSDPWINGEAINEIVKIGETSVDFLIRSLSDSNDNVRWCSSIALEKISPNGIQSIPYLIKSLEDKNSNVRWCSSLALGKFQDKANSSIPYLQKLLHDDDFDVRWAAFASISKIDKSSLNIVPNFSKRMQFIENLIPDLINELFVPGVSISIINNYQIIYNKTFGTSDAESKTKTNENTMFEACSMSKPIFTLLVLQLVEQGKFDLDKPLFNYYPEIFASDNDNFSEQISARMILSHTSGMPNWRKGDEERNGPIPIYFKPGMKFNYSGEGFYYLQRVIEKITNQSLETFARINIFDKLLLNSTSFIWEEKYNNQIATGHNSDGKVKERKKYLHSNAAFTLYTTSKEYAKIILEILNSYKNNKTIFAKSSIDEMLSHQVRVDSRDVIERPGRNIGLQAFRGLGWAIDSTITGDVIYHSGANQTGFRCYSQFSPKDGSGIVIMTNGENGNELWRKLIQKIGDL